MIYHRRCTNCGSDVLAKNAGGVIYCDDCKELDRQERRAKRLWFSQSDEVEYTIIRDPIEVECGGFAPGARLPKAQVMKMLLPDFRGFNVGTIIEARSGERFLIVNKRCSNGLRLQKIGANNYEQKNI